MFPRSRREAAAYLAAMIDGEGSVSTKKTSRCIAIANTDPALIEACCRCCDVLGVDFTLRWTERSGVRGRKPIARLRIGRMEQLARLAAILPIQAPEKKSRLLSAATPRPRPVAPLSADELRRLYWDEGLTLSEIAHRYGASVSAAHLWCQKLGVPRRSDSQAQSKRWASLTQEERNERAALMRRARYGR